MIVRLIFLLSLLFFYTYTASAQEEDHIKTGAVKVTATKVEKELLEVPSSVSIITEDDIKKTSARNIGELLQDVPGVQILNSGGQGLKRISLRGEGVNRTLILIDGQQIVENKSMDGTAIMIDPSMVERIEVIRGPSSVLYGSNAIGGVVNIITKKGGKKPVEGSIGLSYNGASSGHAESASIFGKAADVEYRVSASNNMQDQLRTPIGLVPFSSFSQQNYSAYLAYNFLEHYKVGASFDYFTSDISSGSQTKGYKKFFVVLPEWRRYKGAVFFEMKEIAPFFPKLRLDVFYQNSFKNMHNHVEIDRKVVPMPAIIDNFAENYNKQWGVQLQTDWAVGDHTYIIAGYDFAYNILDATTSVDSNSNIPVMRFKKYTKNYGYELSHALYAQGESYLPLDFSIFYGVRWTYNYSDMDKATGSRYNKDNKTTIALKPEELGPSGISSNNAPVFSAGIMWSGIENFSIRFNYSQGFRSPSLQEKYIISSMGGGLINPNPYLKPETSNNFEFGLRYNDYGVSLDAVYFVSIADNYITQVPVSYGNNETRYKNVSNSLTHGAEISLGYMSPIGLKPYVNMAVIKRRYRDAGIETWKTGVPLVTGKAGLLYTHTFNNYVDFTVDLFSRFASKTEDELNTIHQEVKNGLYFAPYGTANMSIGVDFGEKREYSLAAEVYNMLNTLYKTSIDIYEPGFYGAVKFSANF